LCETPGVDLSIVNGELRVAGGELIGVDLPSLIRQGNQQAAALVLRTGKRYDQTFTTPVWRRAYPFEPLAG
jgi:hypothetical protein